MFTFITILAALLSSTHAFTTSTTTVTSTTTLTTITVTASIVASTSITSTETQYASGCNLTPTVTATTVVVATDAATVTTTTVSTPTTTTTITATSTCSTPSICGNAGLQYAYISVPAAPTCTANTPKSIYCSNYDPANYKNSDTNYTGVTTQIGGFQSNNTWTTFPVYGRSIPANYFILNHRGYFFAPQTGTYNFKFALCDDKGWLWLGPKAYSGYNAANANNSVVYTKLSTGTYNTTLTQNTYVPFRLYFTQGNGWVNLSYTITGPDGSVLADSTSASPYFVQQSCDGVTAPAYPPYGKET